MQLLNDAMSFSVIFFLKPVSFIPEPADHGWKNKLDFDAPKVGAMSLREQKEVYALLHYEPLTSSS